MSSLFDVAQSIEASLTSRPLYCSGTIPVRAEQLTLFYDVDSSSTSKLDLSNSTPEQLDKLSDACQPATFGLNNEDVYDESYRKARKLDITNFATSFNIHDTGLIDVVHDALLDENRRIKVEMYKLNVYGKDSFFKPHKDTPRSASMFGSLVVVFPTPHEGGEFTLRKDSHEWVVDFSKMISETTQQPCVGYVSFFSDVEHEVRMVTAGHRVTLTYNLYFTPEAQTVHVISSPAPYEQHLAELLYTLLTDPDLLPDGGYLGFGLRHQYPVSIGMSVGGLWSCLKGNDATLARVLSALDVTWDIRVFYDNDSRHPDYLHDFIVDLPADEVEDYLDMGEGAEEVSYVSLDGKAMHEDPEPKPGRPEFAMVTKMASKTYEHSPYAAYGNEVWLNYLYGGVYLVAELPALEDRNIEKTA